MSTTSIAYALQTRGLYNTPASSLSGGLGGGKSLFWGVEVGASVLGFVLDVHTLALTTQCKLHLLYE